MLDQKKLNGPLAKYFDQTLDDEFWGEKTWEKAESKIIKETVNTVISKSGIPASEIDCMFAGDLLNQCISSSFGLREENIPFFGVFGACSTFVEGISLGAIATESYANNVFTAKLENNIDGGMLCIPIIYSTKWHASVDGKTTETYNINGGLIGVLVSAGKHDIRLEYDMSLFADVLTALHRLRWYLFEVL